MTNVLVPVDGSESATRAVRWVIRMLADQAGAPVQLVHVQPAIDAWEVRSHLGADDIARWYASASQAILEPAAAIVREAGIEVTTHPAVGDIASEVAACVTRLGCDSLVMGSRGLGPVQSLLLGSAAMKVIHVVDVPITLIKCPAYCPGQRPGVYGTPAASSSCSNFRTSVSSARSNPTTVVTSSSAMV